MPLFRKKKEELPPVSLKVVKSNESNVSKISNSSATSKKFKLFKHKVSEDEVNNLARDVNNLAREVDKSSEPRTLTARKRVSTIAENDIEELNSGYNSSDFDSELSLGSDYDDSDDDYVEHLHAIKMRGKLAQPNHFASQLSTIMGYCGMGSFVSSGEITDAANEELKRTFSLLDQDSKIHHLPSATSGNTLSVIEDPQIQLIENLKKKLNKYLLSSKTKQQYECVSSGKTLYQRYGIVKDVIGRGSYGIIKIIDPDPDNGKIKLYSDNGLFAVKELLRRGPKESNDIFVDRVLSEFLISSTLNSKHIVKTVDLMITLPSPTDQINNNIKFSQVMECTSGGDLFTYLTTGSNKKNVPVNFMSLDEVDCFIKQIAKGLKYIHQHGVAHCDLKLENILLTYVRKENENVESPTTLKIVLKISDFGKSSVIRTKWDKSEQYLPKKSGPLGSEPYMAPEEFFSNNQSYSLTKKDCWAFGIIVLLMFNIRKHYYSGIGNNKTETTTNNTEMFEDYSSGYLWQCTDVKSLKMSKEPKYKDKVFEEYSKTRMLADYDDKTKEWTVNKMGTFVPIENLFKTPMNYDDSIDSKDSTVSEKPADIDDLGELRRWVLYKLLDINPDTRMSIEHVVRSDWMTAVEICE